MALRVALISSLRLLSRTPASWLQKDRAAVAMLHQSKPKEEEAEEGVTGAMIAAIRQETPTVKRFTLQLDKPRSFCFLPGQWVDFFVPGIAQVGGYSIISTPLDLELTGQLQLAVKRSGYPPAVWLHDKARPGDRVQVRVGGTFHYLPGDESRPLLFLAGGIGITPLISILRHCWQQATQQALRHASLHQPTANNRVDTAPQQQQQQQLLGQEKQHMAENVDQPPLRAAVLFSASTPKELALLPDLQQLQQQSAGGIRLQLRATSPEWQGRDEEWGGQWGRFTAEDIQAAVEDLCQGPQMLQGACQWPATATVQPCLEPVLAFVCGPPAMLEDSLKHLRAAGLAEGQIRYEKWW